MSIDRRISYKVVIDTETAKLDPDKGVNGCNSLVYDFGYAIVDKRGNVYLTRSFVISDIFDNETDRMNSAYYNNKIPMYKNDLVNGSRIKVNFYTARKIFLSDLETYKVIDVFAHNAKFDYYALNTTLSYLTNGKYRYFFPKNLIIHCTNEMAKQVIQNTPTYKRFCENNGYLTKHSTPKPQTKAEILYRYITQNTEFIENHTGLEDVLIEKEILAYCYRKHKKMNSLLFPPKANFTADKNLIEKIGEVA